MMKFVNAMGDACPIPVVKTKNAIKEMNGEGMVETLVDNEVAVQNLTKMAQQKNYSVRSEKLGNNQYRVIMTIGESEEDKAVVEEEETCIPDAKSNNKVVVISTQYMGTGDDELGAALMKSFIYALAEQDELPKTILFYNGGVKLTTVDGPILEDLKSLEAQGVEIMSCGTCLNYYGLTDELKVGSVTNMYVIIEKQMQASVVIKP